MSASGGVFHAYQISITCNVPPAPPSDCLGSISGLTGPVDYLVQPNSTGYIEDLDPANQGCLGVEHSGFWLNAFAEHDGILTLMSNTLPASVQAEVDFAIWGPFPTINCTDLGAPIRCSIAATGANTGLQVLASDENEEVDGDGWLKPICASLGEYYAMYISVEAAAAVTVRVMLQISGNATDCLTLGMAGPRPAPALLSLHPQPASEELRVQGLEPGETAFVHGMDGPVIASVDAADAVIDVRHWPSGSYVLRSGASSTRFVVAH